MGLTTKNRTMKRTAKITKYLSTLEEIKIFFEDAAAKKQESYDSKSERWQESDAASEMQDDISTLEDISNSIDLVYSEIENAFESED